MDKTSLDCKNILNDDDVGKEFIYLQTTKNEPFFFLVETNI